MLENELGMLAAHASGLAARERMQRWERQVEKLESQAFRQLLAVARKPPEMNGLRTPDDVLNYVKELANAVTLQAGVSPE